MSLVVRAHRPWKTRALLIVGLVSLCLLGWALFEFGRDSAGYDSHDATQAQQSLEDLVGDLNDEIKKLREQKAILERDAAIERTAYHELDGSLKLLQTEILELKEELSFYRGIVSPNDAVHGLYLQRFRIEPNGKTRGYRYRVILTQVLKNDRTARGLVQISVEGILNGEAKVLHLKHVTEKSVKELSYRFKYFQNLEGDIQLPDNFKPQRITVTVIPKGRRNQETIEKTFDWPR